MCAKIQCVVCFQTFFLKPVPEPARRRSYNFIVLGTLSPAYVLDSPEYIVLVNLVCTFSIILEARLLIHSAL